MLYLTKMIRHNIRLNERDLSVTLLSLALSHITIIFIWGAGGSSLIRRMMMVHLLRAMWRLKNICRLGSIILLLLLRQMLLSWCICRLQLLNLLLYLIGRVCWVLWLTGMCILTTLLAFARTILRLITGDWKLLWALRRRVRSLSVIPLVCATLLRLRNVRLRAGREVTIWWKSASLI